MSDIERLAIEERRAYSKQWREAHKEQTREYTRRHWQKKAAARLAATEQTKGE